MKLLGRELGLFARGTHPTRPRTLLGEEPPGVKERGRGLNRTLSMDKPLSRSSLNIHLSLDLEVEEKEAAKPEMGACSC